MNLQSLRLSVRLARFELFTFGAAILLFAGVEIAGAAWIDSLRPGPDCLGATSEPSLLCSRALDTWYRAQQGPIGIFSLLLLFCSSAVGIFLGVPIVGREVERGTARLAWSLAPSRIAWFASRTWPSLLVVALLTMLAGIALDRMVASTQPQVDPANAFVDFGARGILVASRAVFVFGIALAAGAVLGKSVPAIVVAALVAFIGLSGGEAVHLRILRAEAVPVDVPTSAEQWDPRSQGDWFMDQKFRLPDGSLVSWEALNGQGGVVDDQGRPRYPMVNMVIPGTRYREVEAREALVLAGGTIAWLVIAAVAVIRRRPG